MTGFFDDPLGHWLLRTTAEGTVLIGVAMIVVMILGRGIGPRWRISLWALVGLKLLIPASVSFSPGLGSWGEFVSAGEETITRSIPADVLANPPTAIQPIAEPPTIGPAPMPATIAPVPEAEAAGGRSLSAWLLAIWLGGTIAVVVTLLARLIAFMRGTVKRSRHDPQLQAIVDGLVQEMGLRHNVGVVLGPAGTTPAASGVFKPQLILPEDWAERFDRPILRYILMHELEHVRFGDVLWNWVAALVSAIHWFNPLVWLAAKRFQADRELRCDADTLARLRDSDRVAYGRALLDVQENFRRAPATAGLAPCVRKHPALHQRIAMITRPTASRRWHDAIFTVSLAALLLLSFGAKVEADIEPENRAEERINLTLSKDGVMLGDEKIKIAELSETLKKKNARRVFVYQSAGAHQIEAFMEALRLSGISMATFRDKNDETLYRILFDPEPPAAAAPKEQGVVRIYRVKDQVEIDGKLFAMGELAAALNKRGADKVLVYLKESGGTREGAHAFAKALQDSGISTAEFRDAKDRIQAHRRFAPRLKLTIVGDGVQIGGQTIALEDLPAAFERENATGVVIRAEPNTPFDKVVRLVDVVQESGIYRISFDQPKEPGKPVAAMLHDRRARVKATENLRALHIAASAYLTDHKTWPQCPIDRAKDPQKYVDWWNKTLSPYGVDEKYWKSVGIDFRAATFSAGSALAPYRKADAPWFEESIGDTKTRASIFPDGHVEFQSEK